MLGDDYGVPVGCRLRWVLGDLVRWLVTVAVAAVVVARLVVLWSPDPVPVVVPDAFGACMADAWPGWNGTGSELAAECAEVAGR